MNKISLEHLINLTRFLMSEYVLVGDGAYIIPDIRNLLDEAYKDIAPLKNNDIVYDLTKFREVFANTIALYADLIKYHYDEDPNDSDTPINPFNHKVMCDILETISFNLNLHYKYTEYFPKND